MSVRNNLCGIADLQDKMLDILKYLDAICKENHFTYWLAGGTCLGALRHQGFIPWDDDLDVYMPRPDYEKLWELLKNRNMNPNYKLCRTSKEYNYHHRVMQIVDLTTTFINQRSVNEDIEHGVYIDIIPIDAKAKNPMGRVCQFVNAILFSVFNIQCKQEFNGGKMTKIINFGTTILLHLIKNPEKRYKIWTQAEKRMSKFDWDTANDLVVITSTFHELITPFPASWFGNRKSVFEDMNANIPSNAEGYCKKMYGDYLQLPPQEQQTTKHNTVFIDLDNPYTEYKGIYYCVKNET